MTGPAYALRVMVLLASMLPITVARSRAEARADDLEVGHAALPEVTARTLFEEGLRHGDEGRWQEAAERFEQAMGVRPSAEIAYNLSTALARSGRLVRASEILRSLSVDEQTSPQVRSAAEARLRQLLPRIPYLKVRLSLPIPHVRVFLDGRLVERAVLGVAFPVDPGEHLLEARRDTPVASITAVVREAERREITLQVSQAVASRLIGSTESHSRDRDPRVGRRRWVGWVALAASAVGVGVAAALLTRPEPIRGSVDTWRLGQP